MISFPAWWPSAQIDSHEPTVVGLWSALQAALDIKQLRPAQADGIISKEMVDGSGRHFMLKNPRAHSYERLSPEEFWIWEHMDGEETVQQIVFAYFMEFKSFAFGAVTNLVGRLGARHMLSEPPRYLYAGIAQELQERRFSHKATWLARVAFTKEWSINGLDSHLDRIYRYGGWILFTLPIQIVMLLVSVIGMFLFIQISRDPRYDLFGEDLGVILLKLGLISYIPIVIHEFGHAITAKHYGCEVYKGGAMLYYGLPAFFVDTTDVWMYGKRARLAVTWAGPYTGYIIGGICTFLVYFLRELSLSTAIFLLQISLVAIFMNTWNLLPVLKLDGYYILADALEIPRLRERSMEFISKGLRAKLSAREKWTRDERIFLFFGIFAFLSTFYFMYVGIRYWDSKTTSSISTLLKFSGDLLAQLLNIGVLLLAVSSILYLLYLLASNGPHLVQWLRKIGLLSTRGRTGLVITLGSILLIMFPQIILPTLTNWFMLAGGVLSFGLAARLAFINFRKMNGSVHAGMWFFAALGFLAGMGSLISGVNAQWTGATLIMNEVGLILSVLMFVFAGRLLTGLQKSWRSISLELVLLGIITWGASLFITMSYIQTLAGFLIFGGMLHWDMRPTVLEEKVESKRVQSTRGQLMDAFHQIKATVYKELEYDFGRKSVERVENGYYRSARSIFARTQKEKADVDQFSSTITGMTPSDYGVSMALALEETLIGMEKVTGKLYAVRTLAYGIDGLNWELQEVAEDYILKYVPHAAGLSQQLRVTRSDIESLVRSVPLFSTLTDREIALLCKHFKSKRFERGEVIFKQGDVGEEFYLIRTGRVEVIGRFDPSKKDFAGKEAMQGVRIDQALVISLKERTLAHLTRSDHFGESALLSNEKRNATARALTPVYVLYLNRNDFNRLIRKCFEQAGSLKRMGILRQIPLFKDFDGVELSMLEKNLEKIEVPAGETIFNYGELGNYFYIIESGRVSVQFPITDDKSEKKFVERAALGSGEYFGEVALMTDIPRTAAVVATQPATLLRLDATAFAELVNKSSQMKQEMERASSRRVLSNRRWIEGS
jgi:CRP-like cAMP-binding protein